MLKSMMIACLCFFATVTGILVLAQRIILPTLNPEGPSGPESHPKQVTDLFYRTIGGFHPPDQPDHNQKEAPLVRSQFTLEIAKVKTQAEAERWLEKLEKDGISAFYTPIHAGNEVIFRVRSGLFSQEQSAKLAQKNIKLQYKIRSEVVGL